MMFPPLRPERAEPNVLLENFHSYLLQYRPLYHPGSRPSGTLPNYCATMRVVPRLDEVHFPRIYWEALIVSFRVDLDHPQKSSYFLDASSRLH
jgi:hypothetical protein